MVVVVWARCFQVLDILFKKEVKVCTDLKSSKNIYSKQSNNTD